MALGVHRTNCTLSAPGYGSYELLVTALGYGKSIVATDEEARRTKTFYAQVAASGEWYVETTFLSHPEMSNFGLWLINYYNRIIDLGSTSALLPMTVTVRSRDFRKVGYPVSTVDFGDTMGQILYPMKVNFVSASGPSVNSSLASRYVAPLRDAATGAAMYPGGLQEPGYTPSPYRVGSPLTGFRS